MSAIGVSVFMADSAAAAVKATITSSLNPAISSFRSSATGWMAVTTSCVFGEKPS